MLCKSASFTNTEVFDMLCKSASFTNIEVFDRLCKSNFFTNTEVFDMLCKPAFFTNTDVFDMLFKSAFFTNTEVFDMLCKSASFSKNEVFEMLCQLASFSKIVFILSDEDPFLLTFVHVSDNHFFRLREHLKKFGKNTQDRVSIMRGEYIIYFFLFSISPLYTIYLAKVWIKTNFQCKIENIFAPIAFSICFGCSKEPSL